MALIILAAGKGVRANSERKDFPKVLLECKNGKSLLLNTLEKNKAISMDKRINIVTGFLSQKITEEVQTYECTQRSQEISLIYNKEYENGVITSLNCGLRDIKEDVVIMNGDTYYSAVVFSTLNDIADSTLLVIEGKDIPDAVGVITEGEKISKVGKHMENASFISIGCLYLTKNHVKRVRLILDRYIRNGSPSGVIWHEIINTLIDDGEEIFYKILPPNAYFEIDTEEDYQNFIKSGFS